MKNKIKAAREAAGLTQAELAAKLGTIQQNVSRWEKGAYQPKLATLRRIAEALEVPMSDLLD